MNDDMAYDDMPVVMQAGYEKGTKFLEQATAAKVFDMKGKLISKPETWFPYDERPDDDFVLGFNASVWDYIQDREIDWFTLFNELARKSELID